MGLVDKTRRAAEDAIGKVKEQTGKATGDRDTQAEGKTDQAKSSAKKAGKNIKDAFNT